MDDFQGQVHAFSAHAGGVLFHRGIHLARFDRLQRRRQSIEPNQDDLIEHVFLLQHGESGHSAGIEGHKLGFQVGIGGDGVLGDLSDLVLVPVAPLANDLDALGFQRFLHAVLAGIACLMTDCAAHDQGLALAAHLLGNPLARHLGSRVVVGLDQRGDVGIIDAGVHGDDGNASSLGLLDGVVPAAGVSRAQDDRVHALGDGGVHRSLLGLGVLHL